jgi:hypothetical protein
VTADAWESAGYGARLLARACSCGRCPLQLKVVTASPEAEYEMIVSSAEDAHALAELVTAAAVLGPAAGGLAAALRQACEWLPLEASL